MQLPPWNQILEDLQAVAILKADDIRYFLDCGERGNAAASAILGIVDVPDTHLDDLIMSPEFLAQVQLKGTGIETATRRCYEIVLNTPDLNTIDVSDECREGTHWLSYFLSALPREAMGGLDYTSLHLSPDAPLRSVLGKSEALLRLAEVVQDLFVDGEVERGFTAHEIAHLGGLDTRTVRNVMGPKGNKPIRTTPAHSQSAEYVQGDPLDTLEWLSARRGFKPHQINADWANERIAKIDNPNAAFAAPAVFAWVQGIRTVDLAKRLDRDPDWVGRWARGINTQVSEASHLAEAIRLDGQTYQNLINRVGAPH